jgi:hypothetical protein
VLGFLSGWGIVIYGGSSVYVVVTGSLPEFAPSMARQQILYVLGSLASVFITIGGILRILIQIEEGVTVELDSIINRD